MNKYRYTVFLSVVVISLFAGIFSFRVQNAAAQNRTLYWGVSGNDVTRLQQQLLAWGYYNGQADGVFGSKTQQSLIKFQRLNGLNPDGVAGPETWAALGFTPTYNYSPSEPSDVSRGVSNRDDSYLLARVIEGEAANEPFTGKVAVGAVILNRMQSSAFPHTLAGIIYQPYAFESVSNGQYNRPVSQESLRAAMMAMSGWDPTGGALFFWNPSKSVNPWVWTRNVLTQIGRHVFAR